MHVIAVDRPGVNDHFVRPGGLANQLAASLPHVAAENGGPIFRNPYNVVLAVPDGMAAAFVALHDPVYTGHAADPCRLKGVGFPDPLSGTLNFHTHRHAQPTRPIGRRWEVDCDNRGV